jgi:hypothetical protein
VFNNLRLSFSGLDPFFHPSVPLIAIGTLVLVATVVCLYKRDVALAAYSLLYLTLFLSITYPHYSFIRYVAGAFPVYLFFGLMLYNDWKKNLTVGSIAVAVAIANLYVFFTGAWLY